LNDFTACCFSPRRTTAPGIISPSKTAAAARIWAKSPEAMRSLSIAVTCGVP
jgi:hypothetical protein